MNKNACKKGSIKMVAMQDQEKKIVYYNVYGGRALRMAVVITMLVLVMAGEAGAAQLYNISGAKYNGSGISLGTMTMTTGQTWSLGAGYEMTINAVDARTTPRQVWFTLKKNGAIINESIGAMGQTYNYNNLFFTKINNIFSGATSDMVQFTETFLVENTAEPLPGWKIYLRNSTTGIEIANTTTGVNGFYKFTGLLPGMYNVSEEMKVGWVNVAPLFQIVTISTSNITNLNFTNMLLIPRFNISGFKINDTNSNGIWDSGEAGIQGWNITLKNSTGAFISSTITGVNGFYQFNNVAQGNYNLSEVMQAGWNNTNSTFKLITLDNNLSNINFTNKNVMVMRFYDISGTKYNGSGISLGLMTLSVGQTWDMGTGWTLTTQSIDARSNPRMVWIVLNKNGIKMDDSIVVEGQIYNYNNLFFTKINRIFSGATTDMVQLTETFLVENTAEPLPGWKIYLRNSTTGIEIANTTTGVNGSYKFTGLLPGMYNVSEEMKVGWVNVAPLFQIVTISTSNITNLNFTNQNFTIVGPSNISNYSISLKSGWNLISIPLNLTSWILGDESAVGNPLNVTPANSLSSIYRYNTTSELFEKSDHFTDWGWWPATGSESFITLEPGRGYWVMTQQDCNLTFTGTAPSDLDIPLDTSWNLIGWYSMNEAGLGEEAVAGTPLNVTPSNSLTSIYRYNTTSALFEKSDHFLDWGWWPATGSESFIDLEPGRGYWVIAQNEAGWRH